MKADWLGIFQEADASREPFAPYNLLRLGAGVKGALASLGGFAALDSNSAPQCVDGGEELTEKLLAAGDLTEVD